MHGMWLRSGLIFKIPHCILGLLLLGNDTKLFPRASNPLHGVAVQRSGEDKTPWTPRTSSCWWRWRGGTVTRPRLIVTSRSPTPLHRKLLGLPPSRFKTRSRSFAIRPAACWIKCGVKARELH